MTIDRIYFPIEELDTVAKEISENLRGRYYKCIYGIPRGGIPLAIALSYYMKLSLSHMAIYGALIVDDIVDSGTTRNKYPDNDFACIHIKKGAELYTNKITSSYNRISNKWIVYPWEENETPAADALMRIFQSFNKNINIDVANDMMELISKIARETK